MGICKSLEIQQKKKKTSSPRKGQRERERVYTEQRERESVVSVFVNPMKVGKKRGGCLYFSFTMLVWIEVTKHT